MDNILYVVHCIDTEGPLNETLKNTFQRLEDIYGYKLKPSTQNLKKIQNKEINFSGYEALIAQTFDKDLINYNNSWNKIEKMIKRITNEKFRNNFKDSYNNGWKFNWFIMDHYGFNKNPRKRSLGIHKIWNKYESFYKSIKIKDNFHFHFHPIAFSKSANHCGTHYFNNDSNIYDILNKKLIDKKWFPSVYRPGFHTIRPDSHWFLEQFIPFDYSNQSVLSLENIKDDLSDGRFGDWRRASKSWAPYHPSHDDYQKQGRCRRFTARCLNIGTRHKILSKNDIDQAFYEVSNNKPAILSFTNHDYREMSKDIKNVYNMIKEVSSKYKKVKFKWCDAREAMRLCLKIKDNKNEVSQFLSKNSFKLKFKKPIFGPQPYLAFKAKNGKYFHDNFEIQKPFKEWSYTFDDHTINHRELSDFCWAANDKYGNTFIGSVDLKNNKTFYKVI